MKKPFLKMALILFLLDSSSLIAQTISYIGPGDHMIEFSTGTSNDPEWITSEGDDVLEIKTWIGLARNFPTTMPGNLIIDFTSLPIMKRFIGSYKTINSIGIHYQTTSMEELELSDKEILDVNRDQSFIGATAALGHGILILEDENGFIKEFNLGTFFCYNGSRIQTWYNPEYIYEFQNFMNLEPRTWYIKELTLSNVRPFFLPEEIELYYVYVKGDS